MARNHEKVFQFLDAHEHEKNVGVQIVGGSPKNMALAAKAIMDNFPFVKWLNLNCGCPSARTRQYGGGSALLAYPEKIAEIVKQIRKSIACVVSVKLRIKENLKQTKKICKLLESEGTDFIVIHGRTPNQGYSGAADWELIKSIKESVNLPVVGNGDLTGRAEGESMVAKEYCDSFMIGRSAMSNPGVFCNYKPNTFRKKFEFLEQYLKLYTRYIGEPELKIVKIKALNFFSGFENATQLRNKTALAKSISEILDF